MLQDVSNILVGLSAVVVAIAAIIGLRQWRAELTGRTKFEIARKIALLAYQFRDEFHAARTTFTYAGESAGRPRKEGETREESNRLDERYARFARLNRPQDTLRKLREATWEAEIILSKEIAQQIQPFEGAFQELAVAMETHFSYQMDFARGRIRADQVEPAELWRLTTLVYGGSETDALRDSVNTAVATLTTQLKQYLT